MLDELRCLFLEALRFRFDSDDVMPLVEKWNFAVERVQGIFDGMIDKSSVQYITDKLAAYEDAEEQGRLVEVVRCRECYFRGLDGAAIPVCTGAMAYCHTPDDWFCAAGKSKDGGQDDASNT